MSTRIGFDLLARPYRTLEYLAFRRTLEKQRFAFLAHANNARRALILGEGDGRFVCEFAKRNTEVTIDCIDASSNMIAVAQERVRKSDIARPERIRFLHRNALTGVNTGLRYDLIVTHFFLDCFSDSDAGQIVAAVHETCAPAATWLIAEFQQPESGWRKWHARAWLRTMYLFFGLATGLETRHLPKYNARLLAAGFRLCGRELAFADLVSSELWKRGHHLDDVRV